MPSLEGIERLKKKTNEDLNRLSHLVGRFHKMVHKPEKPEAAKHTPLDRIKSVYWAAALAQALSENTCRFRDSMMAVEPIQEEKRWPDPDPIKNPKITVEDLWLTIKMTASMELGTFRTMTAQYRHFRKYQWHPKPLRTIHDLLHEILLNTNHFIAAEPNFPISIVQPPPPPTQLPGGGSERAALISLEHGLRRYLEVHMQIATFVPAHLRNAPRTPTVKF